MISRNGRMGLFALAAMLAVSAPAMAMNAASTKAVGVVTGGYHGAMVVRAKHVHNSKAQVYRRMVRLDEGGS